MLTDDNHLLATQLRPLLTRLVRKLRKLSPADELLSQSERAVMVLLDQHRKLLSGELAIMEKMTPQSMGQLLNHLAELKLIEKKISATDKRKVLITLSATGRQRIVRVRKERDEWLSKAIEKVCTEKEKALLFKAIGPLTKLVDLD